MSELNDCIERLSSEDEAERIYAAEDIGFANLAGGVGPLFARLDREASRAVGEAIFSALQQIESEAVIEGALGLLDSDDPFLRNHAVDLLRGLGRRTLPYLEKAFVEGGQDRRKFVIDVAAMLADPAPAALYRQALADADLNVVITAVENIGNTRQGEFREELEAMIAPGAHPMLLGAAMEALAQMGASESPEVVRRRFGDAEGVPGYLRPSYLKLLGAQGSPVQVGEVEWYARTGALDGAALNALTMLRNRFPGMTLPRSLAGPLREMAGRNPSQTAYQAIRLLSGLAGEAGVLELLEGLLNDEDKVIRIGAVQALRESGGERVEARLAHRLAGETDAEVLQAWNGKSPQ